MTLVFTCFWERLRAAIGQCALRALPLFGTAAVDVLFQCRMIAEYLNDVAEAEYVTQVF